MRNEKRDRGIKDFTDFDVYKKAYNVSLEIHKLSQSFPKEEQFSLTNQIRRSSKSICANIAEGFGKNLAYPQEFKKYLVIAKGSCEETRVWISYCHDLGYLDDEMSHRLSENYIEIAKMLWGLHQKWT